MDAVMAHRLFARRLALPPLVHHEDGFNHDEADRLKPARNLFRRIAMPTVSALVVPSQMLERIALSVWHQSPARVRRIANGIPFAGFARPARPDALPGLTKQPADLWIGTMAGLRAVKNLPRLVAACRDLPAPWKLVIVGEGPERQAIAARIAGLGMADRVFLPGHASDPAAVMPLFDIFALSSDSEQFPISVVEAMAAGIPVAATDVGDITAMIAAINQPYVAGIASEPALAAAVGALAADAGLRAAIGAANRNKAQTEYGEDAMIAAYRETYGKALGRAFG
jgi:glycosyltransferase involved in cell wall biosynthesis